VAAGPCDISVHTAAGGCVVQQEWLLRLHALLAERNVPLGSDGTHNSLRSHTDGHAGSSPDM